MALNGLTIATGATISASGGTDIILVDDGKTVANGIHIIEGAATNFLLMKNATFSIRRATQQKDGSYSKRVANFSVVVPVLLADNVTYSYSVVRGSIEVHPELNAASVLDIRKLGAQVLISSSADAFFNNGAIV